MITQQRGRAISILPALDRWRTGGEVKSVGSGETQSIGVVAAPDDDVIVAARVRLAILPNIIDVATRTRIKRRPRPHIADPAHPAGSGAPLTLGSPGLLWNVL